MRILIAGTGAIGSMLASYLAGETDIWLLGRSWHLEPIKERGYLTITLPNGTEKRVMFDSSTVSTKPKDLTVKNFDVIIVTVKAYDTQDLLQELRNSKITADCYVLFQNGLGNEVIAREFLPAKRPLLRGITNNGAHIPAPGKVVHAGKGETMFGSVTGTFEEWCNKLVLLFNQSGLETTYEENMKQLLWKKVAINAVINPLTALLHVKNKYVREIPEVRRLGKLILEEIKTVAKVENIEFTEIESTVFTIVEKTAENWSSMAQDIKQGKQTEIDFLNGAVLERAKSHNIATPINTSVYLLIKALEKGMNPKA